MNENHWFLIDVEYIDSRPIIEMRCSNCGYTYKSELDAPRCKVCPECGAKEVLDNETE